MSSGWKKFWTFVLGALFVVAFIAFVAGIVVRRDLLDSTLYTSALAENDVYNRVYSDVLGDPAMQNALADAIGVKSNLIAGELYAELVSAINMVVPPPRLENVTEGFITNLTDYLAGRTPEIQPGLNFGNALDIDVLTDRVLNAITVASAKLEAKNISQAEAASGDRKITLDVAGIDQYFEKLRNGGLPAAPTTVAAASNLLLTAEQRQTVLDELLKQPEVQADAQVQLQIEGALAGNDLAGAIGLATRAVLRDRVSTALTKWVDQVKSSQSLDGLALAAESIGQKEATLVNALNAVRGYATMVQNLLVPLALLLGLLLALIVWINSNDLKAMLKSAGWTLIIAGGLAMLLWYIAGLWLGSTLKTHLAGNFGLPAGVDAIVDDVVGAIASGIYGSLWGVALTWFIVGLVTLLLANIRPLFDFLVRLLKPVWAYKGWVLGGLLVLLVVFPLLLHSFITPVRAASLPCNGHVELCDRAVNEVVFATSHNSMSISEYGWLWSEHDGTLTQQLDDGVRALLIDSHYWDTAQKIADAFSQLTPEMRAVAEQALEKVGREDRPGTYLCHNACVLGASTLVQGLTEITDFLAANPREVIFIVIQDEISPADTEAAVKEAGLDKYLYTHKDGEAWPTLRQMIDANTRLVVMAEKNGPPPDWYQNVWTNTMETPYTFINYDDFSCRPNRGDTGKPFFLMNHWIQRGAPNRVDSEVVNSYDFLLARAEQCAQERGKMPNFVAVNFYRNGDLFDVVDTLNGVRPKGAPAKP